MSAPVHADHKKHFEQVCRPWCYRSPWIRSAVGLLSISLFGGIAHAQLDFEAKPICYQTAPTNNRIQALNEKLQSGEAELEYDEAHGYLRSALSLLDVPISSQMLVFSKTSFQLRRISRRRPRAVYFNDDVYVGWVQDGDVVEISVADDNQGAIFYTLSQQQVDQPSFVRDGGQCIVCHASSRTSGVPGHLVRSVFASASGQPHFGSGTFTIDHRSPFEKRWGGWFVTGTHGAQRHMGNVVAEAPNQPEKLDRESGANVTDLTTLVNTSPYLSSHSDIVALMVMEHQARMHNLITRANFDTRSAQHYDKVMNEAMDRPADHRSDSATRRIKSAAEKLVAYMLYTEEAELTARVEGTSKFADEFTARGPHDRKGRSLREFDLKTRMMKYPCSHLIYSKAFDKLPAEVQDQVYLRLFAVLSGQDTTDAYAHLSQTDRRAILEILLDTKSGLPDYWTSQASS